MMGQLREPCTNFAPQHDPVKCKVCFQRLVDHHKNVREAFFRSAPDRLMEAVRHRQGFLNLVDPAKCALYRPTEYGSDVILCDCGRLRTEHNLRVIVKGSGITRKPVAIVSVEEEPLTTFGFHTRAAGQCGSYRKINEGTVGYCNKRDGHVGRGDQVHLHKSPQMDAKWTDEAINGRKEGEPCKSYDPKVDYPGHCRWCHYRYIDHPVIARGRHVEEMTHMHSPGCHCVQKLGDQPCSCLTDTLKQQMLVSLGEARRAQPKVCQRFTPALGQEQMSMHCVKCNKSFYSHEQKSCDGFLLWSEWRAIRMTDAEVLKWFTGLGNDMSSRVNALQRTIEKFDRMSPFAPSKSMCIALMDMMPLDAKKLVQPPPIKHKTGCHGSTSCDCDRRPDPVIEKRLCSGCNQPLDHTETDTCMDCIDFMVKHNWGRPVMSPPKSKGGATEPSINREGEWEGFSD